MSCTHNEGHACSFIPPYMLEHIAGATEHVHEDIRACAERSLHHTLHYRTTRLNAPQINVAGRSGFIPQTVLRALGVEGTSTPPGVRDFSEQQSIGDAKKPPSTLQVKREIYDAKHAEETDGLELVKSDANPSTVSVEKTVTDCFTNLGLVYKFYADIFGRDSIDDAGLTLRGIVHYSNDFENAFWDGKEMVFGDGGTFLNGFTRSLDVVGHELTHGVTERTAKLEYRGQSGALNESISDVFGSMIRQYRDKASSAEADWLIGEDCVLPDIKGLALRSMKAPGTAYDDPKIGKDPQPDSMKGYKVLPETSKTDYGGVHLYSGIPNRAFFLTATGLGGNSWDKAGPIWYKVLTGPEITNKCDFKTFAGLTVDAAKSLYGDAEAKVVKDAWLTVGVLQ